MREKPPRQRCQDNLRAATLGPRRPSAPGDARAFDAIDLGHPGQPSNPTQIHSALNSFADECRGMLVHLAVYLGVLALLAIIGAHLWAELPDSADLEPAAKAGWSLATRSISGFRRQSVRFVRKNRDLRDLPASRGWPQGRFAVGGPRRKAGRRTRNLSPWRRSGRIRIRHRRNRRPDGPRSPATLETAGVIESKFGRRVGSDADFA